MPAVRGLYRPRHRLTKPRGFPQIIQRLAPRGLVLCAPLSEPGFKAIHTGGHVGAATFPVVPTLTASPALKSTPRGMGLRLSGGGTCVSYQLGVEPPLAWSLETLIWVDSPTAGGAVCGFNQLANGTGGAADRLISNGAETGITPGHWHSYLFDGAAKAAYGPVDSTTGFLHLVGTTDGSLLNLYYNGVFQQSTVVANGGYTAYTLPEFLCIGLVNTAFASCTVLFVNFANVTWTPAEVQERYLNPFGFLAWPEDLRHYLVGVAAGAAPGDWGEFNNWEYPYRPQRRRDLGGPSFVASPPRDLLPLRLGYDLAAQPLMRPEADRVTKSIPEVSGPIFVTSKPADLLPLRLGYDLAAQPLMRPEADRVTKSLPEVSGPIFVTSKPADLLPLRLGYELTTPPMLTSENQARNKGAVLAGISNLPDVLVPPAPAFTWSPDPVLLYAKSEISRGAALVGASFVTAKPSDVAAPVLGYDLAPQPLIRAVLPRSIMAASGLATLVLSVPSDLLPLAFGYELTTPALTRARRRAPLPDTFSEPSVLVVITPTAYGYEAAPQPLLSMGRLRRPGALLGQSVLVLSQPADLRAPVFGYELTTPALTRVHRRVPLPDIFVSVDVFVPPATAFTWSPDPVLPMLRLRRWIDAGASLVLVPPTALLGYELVPAGPLIAARRPKLKLETGAALVLSPPVADVWGFGLTPNAPPIKRRGGLIAVGPTFVAASPGDIARPALGYELTTPPLLPVPGAPRRGGQLAIPVFVPVAASDLRTPDYGYDLTPGLYTLLRAIGRNTGFFLQAPMFARPFELLGFLSLIGEALSSPRALDDLLSASGTLDDLLSASGTLDEDLL